MRARKDAGSNDRGQTTESIRKSAVEALSYTESSTVVFESVARSFVQPPLDGLARQLRSRRDRASDAVDSFVRETFTLPRDAARVKAREWFERYPKAAYWTSVESWRLLPGDEVEFTMRRLPTAD